MRKSLALVAAALTLSAAPFASASGTLGTILFGHPSEPGITVIVLHPSDRDDRAPSIFRHPSPDTLARAQGEIASNPGLRASLDRRNIRPHNVLAVQTALDGSKIVYAR
ncbi:hypothetical protein OIU34_04985 [Pararhizobium sp. BT-229]|uniref:hypothetical protein n=1 Tax=Pararhizobium sp. BT-229 TaxID=2986923 RepID=UPI0021F7EB99|nr:hypothetical protein [Pararhizobium sp. BT-229]MCV9961247.1 hypothetical protein [Pararhizobium sp. BT-229]